MSLPPESPGAPFDDPDSLEVVPGFEASALEGAIPSLATEADLREALNNAFDYRGDITLTRRDGSTLTGYLYDRVEAPTLDQSLVRLWPRDSDTRLSIPYSDITHLVFSGRDTAAGRGWEAWLRQYWQKKSAGETNIQLTPEPLD
ncbi:MAG: hypothetical protein J0L64_23735 [Acidobacteria bacterium]|nr:hypothetical protein [Acidobacteriota bacterium]